MKAKDKATELIKGFEGLRLKAYLCPAGKWTIGYGQTGRDIVEGTVWTLEHAELRLSLTIDKIMDDLLDASPILKTCESERFAALISFVYNFGIVRYNESTLKLRVDQGNWVSAATEIKRWNKITVNGVKQVCDGLISRRLLESHLLH